MLTIQDLSVSISDKQIIKGLDLQINAGEVHAIMGHNGSGKSTLANVIAGRNDYVINSGSILFEDKDITEMEPEIRAREGIFLAFQYPVEIPGVNNIYLLKAALNSLRVHQGKSELDAVEFFALIKEKMPIVQISEELLHRSVNHGFSGGEKKRNEIFQMSVLEPKLAILDETDSGLDIDALKIVANGVNSLRSADRAIVLITHYQRLLDYIIPDHVHVLSDGKIIKSGDKTLAIQLEQKGYNWVIEEAK
ncbi:Iron-sulfur cluster assembly ATPase protein SufC [uncultured Candidatus Thioglobus sp.]|nr:Iron-sulfur cluster assembly ATPase protein SufC [uncultured Candidatus Thioglobus sp.]